MAMPIPTRPVMRVGYGTRSRVVRSAGLVRPSALGHAGFSPRPLSPDKCIGYDTTCAQSDLSYPCIAWSDYLGLYCSACCL